MQEERQGDLRVPLISCIFFILVITGGVLLVIYVFVPDLSQPWFPGAALVLIGSPWFFWLTTYIYTCLKACFRGARIDDHQTSRRGAQTMQRIATTSAPEMGRAGSKSRSAGSSPNGGGGRHVHFGQVVVMEGEESRGGEGTESSIASSKEIEMPLNLSASS